MGHLTFMLFSTAMAAVAASCLAALHLVRRRRGAGALSWDGVVGWTFLTAIWGILVPFTLWLHFTHQTAAWVFGSETYDGGVVETLTGLSLLGIIAIAVLAMVRAGRLPRWLWGLIAIGAVMAFGEEASWGQHLFHWQATGAFATDNLQAETNLHNFVSPRIYDLFYIAFGWVTLAFVALLAAGDAPLRRLVDHYAPGLGSDTLAVGLLLSAGILIQHEIFEEMAEAVVFVAFARLCMVAAGMTRDQPHRARRGPAGAARPLA